jgi:tRNA uridine 5-carbamoylmethylation protein Kti12
MLIALCGVAGSGKTTLSKQIAEQLNAKLYCYDDLPNCHNPVKFAAVHKQMWSAIDKDLRNGYDVVCDDLHTTFERRNGILSAIDTSCKKVIVVMKTPLEECLRRNANRPQRLPDFYIRHLHENFQYPTLDEGWDEIIEI